MKRLLVLCARDWHHPRAGWREHYVHQVFSRIAASGHYVLWVAGTPFSLMKQSQSNLVIEDNIQIARLGIGPLHRPMTTMLLRRLASKQSRKFGQFDVIVDCVSGTPFPLADYTQAPVVPLVFTLSPRMHADEEPPGPVVATCEEAERQLKSAGVNERYIARAFGGVDEHWLERARPLDDIPRLLVMGALPRTLVAHLRQSIKPLHIDIITHKMHDTHRAPDIDVHQGVPSAFREVLYPGAHVAFCGQGAESEIPILQALGVAVIQPRVNRPCEWIIEEETGLIVEPHHPHAATAAISRLLSDQLLGKRLRKGALDNLQGRTWRDAAKSIFATVESL